MSKPLIYSGDESFIFVSYSHRNTDTVWGILEDLQKDGFRFWYDDGIEPGESWDDYIASHINDCGYFIAFISKDYAASDNCIQELRFAIESRKEVLIVRLDPERMSPGLEMRVCTYQFVNAYDIDSTELLEKVENAKGIKAFRPETEQKINRYSYKEGYARLMRSLKSGHYCEAMLLEHEILDNTLFWCLYNMGLAANTDSLRIRDKIRSALTVRMVSFAGGSDVSLGVSTLESKLRIVELLFRWANESTEEETDPGFKALAGQLKSDQYCNKTQLFRDIANWCAACKDTMSDMLKCKIAVDSDTNRILALRGQEYAKQLNYVYKDIRRGNRVRNAWGLK